MTKVAPKKKATETTTPDDDARDVVELLAAANCLRAVAYRRNSETLHELASVATRFIKETFGGSNVEG